MTLDYGFLKGNKWQAPIWCRLFGHKFLETKYEVNVFLFLKSPLFICERCKMGQWMGFDRKEWTTPEQVEVFIRKQSIKAVPENVVTAIAERELKKGDFVFINGNPPKEPA